MGEKIKKSKTGSLNPAKMIKPEDKIMAARKTLVDMKKSSWRRALGNPFRMI